METRIDLNNNPPEQEPQPHPQSDNNRPQRSPPPLLKPLLYLLSYPLFLLLLISYLLSRIYTLLCGYFLRQLPPEDACWANESPGSPSHIILHLKIRKNNPNFHQELKSRLERLVKSETYAKLSLVICEKWGVYCYQESSLDLDKHLVVVGDMSDPQEVIQASLGTVLSGERPQWRIYMIEGSGSAHRDLILVFHHSYGDGISWVGFIANLSDDPVEYYVDPYHPPIENTKPTNTLLTLLLTPHHFASQLTCILTESNQFHGKLANNPVKTVAKFVLPLSEVKESCQKDKLTFTQLIEEKLKDGFLRVFTRSLPSQILTISPYAKLPYTSFHPVNQFYPCFNVVNLERGGTRRANNKKESSKSVKECNLIISRLVGGLVTPLQKLIAHTGARGTIAFSNLPCFKREVVVCGEGVEEIYFTPPVKFRTGLSLGLVGYAGRLYGSLGVDKYVIDAGLDVDGFLRGWVR